jgi:hypothetical protein
MLRRKLYDFPADFSLDQRAGLMLGLYVWQGGYGVNGLAGFGAEDRAN